MAITIKRKIAPSSQPVIVPAKAEPARKPAPKVNVYDGYDGMTRRIFAMALGDLVISNPDMTREEAQRLIDSGVPQNDLHRSALARMPLKAIL